MSETLEKVIEESEKETRKILSQPIVQERGRHRRNWQAHLEILTVLDNLFCPDCGKSALSHLRWICHDDVSINEAKDKAGNNFEDASKREEIDPRFWNEEVRKKALERLDRYFRTGRY